ncbi:N-acetylglucosamine-6-phosphate deacetylase [Virgibacillus phasianinus]|uniref:N-acetylglucosamine-6-phosphate deacetylase n=1 Tax=Virgibacillus phasianinus TaxID=2017483 RepID=A0A220U941_9BACI|nr:N-acetylglucosamine-6-phosphate deacetylase [Virgibacillus phasianinus]ASK64391.1 N-acetylglucosamine-6-phosphate deacetylase [Virgibacillus phasianinus]
MNKDKVLVIKNTKIYTENKVMELASLVSVNGKITAVYEKQDVPADFPANAVIIDGTGKSLIPGFIDGHIHGANGADVMDATETALDAIAGVLPKEGTTSFLATTITQSKQEIEAALKNVAAYANKIGHAEVIGVHLEGPFIERSRAGAQPIEYIVDPNIELFKKWQLASGDKIKTITMAPEHDPDGRFIQYLIKNGVNVSAGHTKSGFSEMKQAVTYGVKQVTHICNAMSGIHHRDIGVVGAALQIPELRAELIADTIHVSPEMMQLIYNTMGSKRLILITDAMRAKCLNPGNYELGGQPVKVSADRALLEDGTLAGSILKMNKAVQNMLHLSHVAMEDIIEMASTNPAKQIGLYHMKGSIAVGKDADLLLVDDGLTIHYTICRGSIGFKEE